MFIELELGDEVEGWFLSTMYIKIKCETYKWLYDQSCFNEKNVGQPKITQIESMKLGWGPWGGWVATLENLNYK